MAFLDKIKQDTQIYFGSRKKLKAHRPGIVKDLTNPQNLALFFHINTKDELDQVRQLLRQVKGKYRSIDVFVFSPTYETLDVITNKSILLFNLNDFNLFGKMKAPLQERFDSERYELFISFAFDADPFTRNLISQINADFKIGPDQLDGQLLYDMTLKHFENKGGFVDFYDQLSHYLSVLNIKSS